MTRAEQVIFEALFGCAGLDLGSTEKTRVILAALSEAGLAIVPVETLDDLKQALTDFVEHEVDYTTRNYLGDPERLGRVIYARNALAAARESNP